METEIDGVVVGQGLIALEDGWEPPSRQYVLLQSCDGKWVKPIPNATCTWVDARTYLNCFLRAGWGAQAIQGTSVVRLFPPADISAWRPLPTRVAGLERLGSWFLSVETPDGKGSSWL